MKKFFIPLLCFLFVILSCENENSPTITEVKPGNITGVLDIYDSDDNSGAFVSLKGTNISTTTNSEGRWTLTNVEPGVYDIIFSKPGYDTTECYGFQFAGNGTAYCNYQYNNITTKLEWYRSQQWAIYSSNDNQILNFDTDGKFHIDTIWYDEMHTDIYSIDTVLFIEGKLLKNDIGVILFFARNNNLSKNNFDDYLPAEDYFLDFDKINKLFKFRISTTAMYNRLDIKSKEKIFVIAYPGYGTSETDLRNGKTRWMGLGEPSNVVEFTVP